MLAGKIAWIELEPRFLSIATLLKTADGILRMKRKLSTFIRELAGFVKRYRVYVNDLLFKTAEADYGLMMVLSSNI